MLGCDSVAAFCASRVDRSGYSASSDTFGATTFSASRRGSRGCSARYTSPIAPSPSCRTIVYPAETWPSASDMRGMVQTARSRRTSRGHELAVQSRHEQLHPVLDERRVGAEGHHDLVGGVAHDVE